MRPEFFQGFVITLFLAVASGLLGAMLGISAGSLITHHKRLAGGTLRFLRIGLWLPFITMWAMPLEIFPRGGTIALTDIGIVMPAFAPAVAFAACYHFLSARLVLGLTWGQVRHEVIRLTLLHALFVVFVSQLWTAPHEWQWFVLDGSKSTPRYEAALLFVAILFLLNWLFGSDFEQSARFHGAVVVGELSSRHRGTLLGAVVVSGVCVVLLWAFYLSVLSILFSASTSRSPLELAKAFSLLVPSAPSGLRLSDIGTSVLEIFGGLLLAAGASLLVYLGMSLSERVRLVAVRVFPLTYVAPMMLYSVSLQPDLHFPTRTAIVVALLALYPFLQALWGLRSQRLRTRLLLATAQSLPAAFAGMFWGENMHAVAGLGFSIAVAKANRGVTDALTVALLVFALMAVLWALLRGLARRAPAQPN